MPDMWQLITQPDILIYLNASFAVSTARAKLNWQKKDHTEQLRRLSHACAHANLIIETDELTPEDVLQKRIGFSTLVPRNIKELFILRQLARISSDL